LLNVFEAESDFMTFNNQTAIAPAQAVFCKIGIMIMAVARIEIKQRVGRRISHDQIGRAYVARHGREYEQSAGPGLGTALVHRAVIGSKSAVDYVRVGFSRVDREVWQQLGSLQMAAKNQENECKPYQSPPCQLLHIAFVSFPRLEMRSGDRMKETVARWYGEFLVGQAKNLPCDRPCLQVGASDKFSLWQFVASSPYSSPRCREKADYGESGCGNGY
jgi:hypothetical protein